MRQVLLESLALGLELKFGEPGLEIFSEVSQIEDVEQLRAIQSRLRTAQTVAELRQRPNRHVIFANDPEWQQQVIASINRQRDGNQS